MNEGVPTKSIGEISREQLERAKNLGLNLPQIVEEFSITSIEDLGEERAKDIVLELTNLIDEFEKNKNDVQRKMSSIQNSVHDELTEKFVKRDYENRHPSQS